MHTESHPLANKTVILNETTRPSMPGIDKALGLMPLDDVVDPNPGVEYWIEDWWDKLTGKSWMDSDYNPAALKYALRGGMGELPIDDDVVYGKIGSYGHLVHVSELGEVVRDGR